MQKDIRAPYLYLLHCFVLIILFPAFADDPRKEIMPEPSSPKLGFQGILVSAGPAAVFTQRYIQDASHSMGGAYREFQGPSNALFGLATEAAYDLSGPAGINHLFPGAGLALYPMQGAYYLDYNEAAIVSNHFHLYFSLYYGRATPRWNLTRHCFAAGPLLNVLLWQKSNVLQRLAWGAGAAYYYVMPWTRKRSLFFSASYKLTPYTNFDDFNFYYVDEYHHSVALTAGIAY